MLKKRGRKPEKFKETGKKSLKKNVINA